MSSTNHILILALAAGLLAACTQRVPLPTLEGSVSPEAMAADWPTLGPVSEVSPPTDE